VLSCRTPPPQAARPQLHPAPPTSTTARRTGGRSRPTGGDSPRLTSTSCSTVSKNPNTPCCRPPRR